MQQLTNASDEKYTPGHCKICRESEHGDYGDGSYHFFRIGSSTIIVCSDHDDDRSDDLIGAIHIKSEKREIPEHEDDDL